MGKNKLFLTVLIVLAVFLSGCDQIPSLEYGDANDPSFAVLPTSDGARHFDASKEWLGDNANTEQLPKIFDKDEFDDGIGSIDFKPCIETEVPVKIMVANRNDTGHPYTSGPATMLYLNMVFDFDNNSEWGFDTTICEDKPVNEWQVKNYRIDVSKWPEGETEQTIKVPIKVGAFKEPFCYRATLSYGEGILSNEWTGTGEFQFGETEDYCPKEPEDGPYCGDTIVQAPESCDPPGALCVTPLGNLGICNNNCQCPDGPPPRYDCWDPDFLNPPGALPAGAVCEDNCPDTQICDPVSCICKTNGFKCEVGTTNPFFDVVTNICADHCPKDTYVCNPNTCQCEPIDEPVSCANNTENVIETDINDYDPSQVCQDDCNQGYECNASSCTCVKDNTPRISCAQNTEDTETGNYRTYPRNAICEDDCEDGFACEPESCVCVSETPQVSCAGNTASVIESDINDYDISMKCKDDCDEGYQCNASSCTCTRLETPATSCAGNTASVIESDINDYESGNVCAYDCADDYACNTSSCTCVKYQGDDVIETELIGLDLYGSDGVKIVIGGGETTEGATDTDGDGIIDEDDDCPDDPTNDVDGDGVCGYADNCPNTANSDQADVDEDGVGDVCDPCPNDYYNDYDNDGVCGDVDNCSDVPNHDQADNDGDGVGDVCDLCPNNANAEEIDSDGDGKGDSCDNCPTVTNQDQADSNDDGQGDACQIDCGAKASELGFAGSSSLVGQGAEALQSCGQLVSSAYPAPQGDPPVNTCRVYCTYSYTFSLSDAFGNLLDACCWGASHEEITGLPCPEDTGAFCSEWNPFPSGN